MPGIRLLYSRAKFVDNELMPLEKAVMAREAAGGKIRLTEEELTPLLDKCRSSASGRSTRRKRPAA